MTVALLIFGLLSDSLLAVLVGLIGSKRNIGFGWAFLLSIILTPIIGLIITLISDKSASGERKWGCLGTIFGIGIILLFAVIGILLLLGIISAL